MATERLQKILAKAGLASRRQAEEWIQLGEVTVNGKVAKLGDKAELGKDAIKVRGKLLTRSEKKTYYLFYKPKNVLTTLSQDEAGRPTLRDFLKRVKERIYPVGRLDFTTEGLLLLTNDGDLTERLQKESRIYRVYQVKVKGHTDDEMLDRLTKGVRIENHYYKAHSAHYLEKLQSKSLIQLVIKGAGAFDVKKFFEAKGFLTEKITRTHLGHLNIRGMVPGQLKELAISQIDALFKQPELGERELEKTHIKKLKDYATPERKVSPTKKAERYIVRSSREAPKK